MGRIDYFNIVVVKDAGIHVDDIDNSSYLMVEDVFYIDVLGKGSQNIVQKIISQVVERSKAIVKRVLIIAD